MILRPAICSNSVWLVAALLFGGMLTYDTVAGGNEMSPVSVSFEQEVCSPPDAWMVPNTLTSDCRAARAFVTTWASEAFDMSAGAGQLHKDASQLISPLMRDGFAESFWSKPACGHDVKFHLTEVEPVDMGATNGAWFEVHGEFQHGKLQPLPVTICVLVGGTPNGGMQIEGYSELTDPLEKLMVARCDSDQDCDDGECHEHDVLMRHVP